MRSIIAFLIAPLTTGVFFLLISVFTGSASEGLWAFGLAAAIAYPIALVVGVPAYIFYRKMGWTGLFHYIIGGLFLSIFPIAILVVLPRVVDVRKVSELQIYNANIAQSVVIIVATLSTIVSFWLIARPDRV